MEKNLKNHQKGTLISIWKDHIETIAKEIYLKELKLVYRSDSSHSVQSICAYKFLGRFNHLKDVYKEKNLNPWK